MDQQTTNDRSVCTKQIHDENYFRILTVGSFPMDRSFGPQKELFNGRRIDKTTPRLVEYSGENGVKSIACGSLHTIFIDNDQRLLSFGMNADGSLGRDTDTVAENYDGDKVEYRKKACMFPGLVECKDLRFQKVAASKMLSVGLDSRGDVYVFGNIENDCNKLGLFVDTPPSIKKKSGGALDFESTKVPRKVNIHGEKGTDIAAGGHHVVILTSTGKIYTFGAGSRGQLGRINVEDLEEITTKRSLFLEPQIVTFKELEESEKITKIFAGQCSSYAVTSFGNLYAWGFNNFFQLGFKTKFPAIVKRYESSKYWLEPFPVRVQLDFKVIEVALGEQHLLLLDTDSNVHSCGRSRYGRLGLLKICSNESDENIRTPQLIERELFHGEAIQSIACGRFFSLALTQSGTVYAWGKACPAIGVSEDNDDIFHPTKLTGPVIDNYRITQISAGSSFSAFIGQLK